MSEPYWVPLGVGAEAAEGAPGIIQAFREGHTFGVLGDLTNVANFPSFFVPKSATQIVKILGFRAKLRAGTSIVIQPRRNGVAVGSTITVTTTAATTTLATPEVLADGDELTITAATPTGTPTDLTFTFILETTGS